MVGAEQSRAHATAHEEHISFTCLGGAADHGDRSNLIFGLLSHWMGNLHLWRYNSALQRFR